MAHQIGLKINHDSVGTDLANTMMKALVGDPKDEAYLARTRSQIENDAVDRRRMEQDILRLKADEARLLGEEARKARDRQLEEDSVSPLATLGVDLQGRPIQVAQPATEAPEIVLESGGRGLPEHLFNADPRHQVIEPPVPIEIGTTSPSELPAGAIADSFLAQRGAPGALSTGQLPQGELSFPPPATLDRVTGVPPELTGPPAPRPPVIGGAAGDPLSGGSREPLIDLAALLGGGSAEEPVPVLPDDYLTPFQGYDDITPRAEPGMVPMESLPEAPVPVEPPNIGMVPEDMFTPDAPEDEVVRTRMPQALHDLMAGEPPPAVDPAPTSAVAPEPPVPVAEPGVPTSAAAEPAPPTPPPAAPAAAAPTMPERSELTIKGADDGKADTAATVQTAKAGGLPREGIDAVIRSIMVGEGSPNEKMQAVQRFLGTIGATYNQDFGPEGDERITENLASLRQGGAALGRESVLGERSALRVSGGPDNYGPVITGEQARKIGLDPAKSFQKNSKTGKWDQIGGGGDTIQVGGKGETKLEETIGVKQGEQIIKIYDDMIKAQEDELSLDELGRTLKNAPTGGSAPLILWADRFGIKLKEGADDLTAANAIISRLVPEQREEGSGQMSDKDIDLFRDSLPKIINQPGGNEKILGYLQGLIEYRKARGKIASKFINKKISREQFDEQVMTIPSPFADLRSGAGGEAAAPAAPGTPVGAAPAVPTSDTPTIKTDADFDALPSGTVFIDPEGNRRTKP